jgi:hypothetical protein
VFGCTSITRLFATRPSFNDHGEPGWLIFLRIIVFGFIPYLIIVHHFKEPSGVGVFGCFALLWLLLFIPCLPTLFVLEVVYLRRVLRNPELQTRFGQRAYHIISLAGYPMGIAVAWILLLII